MAQRKILFRPNTREMLIKNLRCYLPPGRTGIVKKKNKSQ